MLTYARNVRTLTPKMTSANTPAPIVIDASGYWDSNSVPYYAFNGSSSDGWGCNTSGGWLRIDLGAATKVYGYSLTMLDYNNAPTSWILEASSDNITYVLLHNGANTGSYTWSTGEMREFEISLNPVAYRYYRITAPNTQGGWGFGIAEMQLLGKQKNRYLPIRGRSRLL